MVPGNADQGQFTQVAINQLTLMWLDGYCNVEGVYNNGI